MTEEPSLDRYFDVLRQDLPSESTQVRLQRRLFGLGLGGAVVLASKTVAASQTAVAKGGLWASASAKFVNLSLLAQFGIVTATTAVIVSGPVVAVMQHDHSAHAVTAAAARPTQPPNREATPAMAPVARTEASLASNPDSVVTVSSDWVGPTQIPNRSAPLAAAAGSSASRASAEETSLVDAALTAIRRGAFNDAEALLDEHQARFNPARLAVERERARKRLHDARSQTNP